MPTQLLPFIDMYVHAKNQSEASIPWRNVSDWLRALLVITQGPELHNKTCQTKQ